MGYFNHIKFWGLTFSVMLVVANNTLAQTDISSEQDGLWNEASTWSDGAPLNPDAANTTSITINHQVTIPSGSVFDIDQLTIGDGGSLIIENGATITVLNAADPDIAILGTGQLNVSGTFRFSNGVNLTSLTAANTNFLSGSVYEHLYTSGAVLPMATWNQYSTMRVTGWTGGLISISVITVDWEQNFGNVEISLNASVNPITVDFNGELKNISGNLTLNNSNTTNQFTARLSISQSPTISIGGDLTVNGDTLLTLSTSSSNPSLTIGNNFNYNSTRNSTSVLFSSGNPTITFQGDLNLNCTSASGGLNVGSTSGAAMMNILGDFNFTQGIFRRNGSGTTSINFNKNGTSQFQRALSGTTMLGALNILVSNNTHLNLGTSILEGTGNFTLNGTLGVGSTSLSGAIPNQILVSGTKTYNSGSLITYNGTSAQVANGHPSSIGVNTIISNGSGVSVTSGSVTMGGNLTIQSGSLTVAGTNPQLIVNGILNLEETGGNLIVGNNAGLALNSSVIPNTKNITTTNTSDLTINGSGAFGTFPFPAGSQSVRNFTLNRSGGGSVLVSNDLTIGGALTLTQGNFEFNDKLNLGGTFSSSGGLLKSSNSPVLEVSSSVSVGTLLFEPTGGGNLFTSLVMSGTGSVTIGSQISISNNINLLNGQLVNSGGISVANGLIVTRNSNSFLSGILSHNPGDVYDVVYQGGSFDTGDELPLPTNTTALRNLTINGGPVSLAQNVTINGNISFSSESLRGGNNSITMNGPQWNLNGGFFDPETSNVVFEINTVINGLSSPTFASIELGASSNLTINSNDIFIAGNLVVNASATSNISDKTIILNGSDFQNLDVDNRFLNNITVNKSNGDVTISSALRLTGILNVQSGTIVFAEGNLTLISTSDDATGNASISSLVGGGSVSGDVTVQRYMSGEQRIYRYLSSPITNGTVAGWQDDFPITGTFDDPSSGQGIVSVNPSLFYYDETLSGSINGPGWQAYPSSGLASANSLIPGVGYAAYIREGNLATTWDLTGPINQGFFNFDVYFTDTDNVDADGYNLLGNPYPSTIDWNDTGSWISFNIGSVIAIRDNGSGSGAFIYSDDQGFPQPGLIATGQAFWIRTTGDSPTLSIDETAKSNQTGIFYREAGWDFDFIEISLSRGTKTDKAYIRQREGALKKLDNFDGPKLQNDFFSLGVQSEDEVDLALSAVDKFSCSDVIPLTLRFPVNSQGNFITPPMGEYIIDIRKGGLLSVDIELYDTFAGTTKILTAGQSYAFAISQDTESYSPNRFELRLVEIPINVAFQLINGENQCGETEKIIQLNGSQPGVDYTLFINGTESSNTISGNGQPLTFMLNNNQLLTGINEIGLKVKNLCSEFQYPSSTLIEVEPIHNVIEVTTTQVCNEGISTLTATGAPAGAIYNWYSLQDGNQVLQNQHGSEFITPTTNKDQIYYVGISNKLGCEGERVPVTVKVVTFEPAIISFTEPDFLASNYSSGNTWFLNGEKIQDDTQSIKISQSGLYRLEVKIKDCLTFSEETFVITSAVEDLSALSIYPNPVIDKFIISSNGQEIQKATIINSMGQEIMVLNTVNINLPQQEINIGHLAPGLFYLVIESKKEMKRIKILKQ